VLLGLDVRNTHTVLGVFDDGTLVQTFRVRTLERSTDELGMLVLQLLDNRGISPAAVTGAICASVVPSVLFTVEKACRRYLNVEPLVVGRKLKTGLRIRTDNPREVGADRIVNSVAALEQFGGPTVVVDVGTATTVDCVTAEGEYIGGAIAPGFKIAEEALFAKTAQLPRVEVARPPSVIGTNTRNAMQSGLFWGYVGMVDALASRCRSALAERVGTDASAVRVVATGQMSNLFGPESDTIDTIEPWLTLRGLHVLYARNT
jgi:type III pantothenate kinase